MIGSEYEDAQYRTKGHVLLVIKQSEKSCSPKSATNCVSFNAMPDLFSQFKCEKVTVDKTKIFFIFNIIQILSINTIQKLTT